MTTTKDESPTANPIVKTGRRDVYCIFHAGVLIGLETQVYLKKKITSIESSNVLNHYNNYYYVFVSVHKIRTTYRGIYPKLPFGYFNHDHASQVESVQ